jgi:hypothetical protein
MEGERIVRVSWASVVVFALVTGLDVVVGAFDAVAVAVCLVLFAASFPVWIYALARAIGRSARGDDIAVASLFFLQGSAPASVQKQLLGAFAASVVVALATAWTNPFSVLVPMLQLGFVGLWGARYGTFPPRRPPSRRTAR